MKLTNRQNLIIIRPDADWHLEGEAGDRLDVGDGLNDAEESPIRLSETAAGHCSSVFDVNKPNPPSQDPSN